MSFRHAIWPGTMRRNNSDGDMFIVLAALSDEHPKAVKPCDVYLVTTARGVHFYRTTLHPDSWSEPA